MLWLARLILTWTAAVASLVAAPPNAISIKKTKIKRRIAIVSPEIVSQKRRQPAKLNSAVLQFKAEILARLSLHSGR